MSEGRSPWRWRRGFKGRGRRPKPRLLGFIPPNEVIFIPYINGEEMGGEPVVVAPDELEALRLVYYLGLTQEEAAQRMGVSRGTLWRLLSSGRKKVIAALVEGRPLSLTVT